MVRHTRGGTRRTKSEHMIFCVGRGREGGGVRAFTMSFSRARLVDARLIGSCNWINSKTIYVAAPRAFGLYCSKNGHARKQIHFSRVYL